MEDVAWGLGGSINKQKLGSWGNIGSFSFDHAKAMTTGEGGMLTFKEENLFLKAKAYQDHGHENNPRLPRWEDSRTSSGFNYRMNEIQGAIGKVQLLKLDKLIEYQNIQNKKMSEIVKNYGLRVREYNKNSYPTSDSFIFFTESKEMSLKLKSKLNDNNINTKILPEAISWHFAGQFNHMKNAIKDFDKNQNNFDISYKNLSKAISLPIMVNQNNILVNLEKALSSFFDKT